MHRNTLLRRVANGRSARAPLAVIAAVIAAAALGTTGVCHVLTRGAPVPAPDPTPAQIGRAHV